MHRNAHAWSQQVAACVQKMTKNSRIDLLKIDIEGYEKEIFSDEASWPVLYEMRCIAAEIHDWFAPGCSDALNHFLQVPSFL